MTKQERKIMKEALRSWLDKKEEKKIFNYEGWLSALDFAEELGCPDSKGWEDKLDALEDAGTSDGAVDAFEGTAIEFIKSKGYKIMEDGKEVFND